MAAGIVTDGVGAVRPGGVVTATNIITAARSVTTITAAMASVMSTIGIGGAMTGANTAARSGMSGVMIVASSGATGANTAVKSVMIGTTTAAIIAEIIVETGTTVIITKTKDWNAPQVPAREDPGGIAGVFALSKCSNLDDGLFPVSLAAISQGHAHDVPPAGSAE